MENFKIACDEYFSKPGRSCDLEFVNEILEPFLDEVRSISMTCPLKDFLEVIEEEAVACAKVLATAAKFIIFEGYHPKDALLFATQLEKQFN